MATRKLGDVAVDEIVKLKENGTAVNYIVVHHGKPSSIYDDSCNGVWLLRERCYKQLKYGSSDYSGSTIQSFLNSTFFNSIEKSIRDKIITVKIPYIRGDSGSDVASGSSGFSTKIFIPSMYELGSERADTGDEYADGAKLDYFFSNSVGVSVAAKKRKSFADYSPTTYVSWYTRTQYRVDEAFVVTESGGTRGTDKSENLGIRPIMLLPTSINVDESNNLFSNSSPTAPPSITIPETIRGGEDTSIIWSASTDPDGNLDGYIVQRSYNGGSSWAQIYQGRSTSTTTTIPFGTETVMFRVCAYDTYGEKSGWRTSENRTVVNNRAPAAPPSISVPLSPSGGDKLTITWTASTDVDGNLEGYELERQWDGAGAFTQIYKGAALSFQDDIPKGEHTSVVYRVRAYDSFASYSSYTTSPSRTIDNNTAPVISCDLSGDLGEKSEGFSIPYTVSDAEQQEVTVVEKVGDLVKRTYKATLDEQATFEITGEYFQKILNGAQTVQIVATDSAGKSSTLSLTFTKAVHKTVITLEEPLAVEEQITVAVLAITGKIPADATQLIELTNNGNDPEPVWEDAIADVKAGRNHPFTNKTQTNGWAFNFRVTVERGESGEDGNIVSIQGGFQ